mmetsp:Transcript_18601/g.47271  ORF Transcript_18601/g.47271 Transcript_18601/m.47271 type:complete len:711 (+) Transcript_18601:172-2304(+)
MPPTADESLLTAAEELVSTSEPASVAPSDRVVSNEYRGEIPAKGDVLTLNQVMKMDPDDYSRWIYSKDARYSRVDLFPEPWNTYLTKTNIWMIAPWIFPILFLIDYEHFFSSVLLATVTHLFLWPLVEIFVHKIVFHMEIGDSKLIMLIHFMFHGIHHAAPRDYGHLLMPYTVSVPLTLIGWSLLYTLTGGHIFATNSILAGFLTGYVRYDLTHISLHSFTPKNLQSFLESLQYVPTSVTKFLTAYYRELKQAHDKHHFSEPDRFFEVSYRGADSATLRQPDPEIALEKERLEAGRLQIAGLERELMLPPPYEEATAEERANICPRTNRRLPHATPVTTSVTYPQRHQARRKKMLELHPELTELMRPEMASVILAAGLSLIQFGVAVLIAPQASWWQIVLLVYLFGAFVDHALWVLIHDFTHNLGLGDVVVGGIAIDKLTANALMCIVANGPHLFPSGIPFRQYHLQHHAYLNERGGDPDVISPLELRLFGDGRSFISKLLWLTFSQISQGLRPLQFKPITSPRYYQLLAVNAVHNIIYGYLAYLISGSSYSAVAYLLFSSLVSIGPHLVGIRWIAEHFQVAPDQETYSCYSSIRYLILNMSCHVEHHDLPRVPWMHLMTVRKIAPEFYDRLYAHSGYWTVLFQYLFDSNVALTSRITRPTKRTDDGVAIDDNIDMLEVEAQPIPTSTDSVVSEAVATETDVAEESKKDQ